MWRYRLAGSRVVMEVEAVGSSKAVEAEAEDLLEEEDGCVVFAVVETWLSGASCCSFAK
jgi:hypothetical protein